MSHMHLIRVITLAILISSTYVSHARSVDLTDTIPPIFTTIPQDMSISCDAAISIELSSWYNANASSEADNGDAEVSAIQSINEVLNVLLESFGNSCSDTGEVEVGYIATDDCNNVSIDTLYASFTVEDNTMPDIIAFAEAVSIVCDFDTQDSLQRWLDNFGGLRASDNCGDSVTYSHYSWVDNYNNRGFVDHLDSTDIVIARDSCGFDVDVQFFIKDACDNINSTSANFSILPDNVAPIILFSPNDTTILCNQSLDDIIPIITDECNGTLDLVASVVTTQSSDITSCEYYNYRLQRIWEAVDACGNMTRDTQIVEVRDTIIPEIEYDETKVVNCGTDLSDVETFLTIEDNCSSTEVTWTDEPGTNNQCQNQIKRTWSINDICRNTIIVTQTIQVQDFDTPTFTRRPSNLTLACDGADIMNTFNLWRDRNANAIAEDNCSEVTILPRVVGSYPDTNAIRNAPLPTIDPIECLTEGNLIDQIIEIFAFDDCGNITSALATFSVLDTVPPEIISCPTDTIIVLDNNDCQVAYNIILPEASDNCLLMDDLMWTILLDDIFLFRSDEVSDISLDAGIHKLTYTISDCDDNLSSCTQEVIIQDNIAPSLTCPVDVEIFLMDDECSITYQIPEIEEFSDNCFGPIDFLQTLPNGNAYINFEYENNDSTYTAIDFPIEFQNVITNGRLFKPVISIDYALNIQEGSSVQIISEFGDILLEITEASCDVQRAVIILEENQFNIWATDEDINFTIIFKDNNGEGIFPCIPSNVSPTDLVDEFSFFSVTLEYSDIQPDLILTDSNDNILSELEQEIELTPGIYNIEYSAIDRSDNIGTCVTMVTIRDTISPILICLDTTINISPNPSDNDLCILSIIESLSDNCEIIDTVADLTSLSCTKSGETIPVTVSVSDAGNNTSLCTSMISILNDSLTPFFVSGLCLADTLKLFSGIDDIFVETYSWVGPNNFNSDISNPVLTSINDDNSGLYTLEIRTVDGCQFVGVIDIEISLFDSPEILSTQNTFCAGDDVLLNSNSFTEIVDYFWYEGISPNGVLINQTSGPTLSIRPSVGEHFYYVEVRGDNCNSNPSNTLGIEVLPIPVAIIDNPFITICEGEDIVLSSPNFDPNFSYEWRGPNGYLASGQIPNVIENAGLINEGTYTLIIKEASCVSDTVRAQVVIFDLPTTPEITAESLLCEGQSAVLSVNNITTGTRYHWYRDGLLFSSTSSNNLIIPSITTADSGEWTVKVEEGICSSETSIPLEIIVETILNIGASNSGPVCDGEEVTLTSSFIPNATYQWEDPQGTFYSGREITVPASEGTYVVTVTTASNCITTSSTNVEVGTRPIITALSNTALPCMDGSTPISLVPTIFPPGNYTYNWSGPNNYISNNAAPIINDANTSDVGTYTLTVSGGDCISEPVSNDINFTIIPEVALLSTNSMPCENSDVNIDILNPASGNTSWIWTTPTGQVVTTIPSLELENISNADVGNYAVIQESNGCRSDISNPITITILDNPTVPSVTGNNEICEGETLILSTQEVHGSTYLWETPNGLVSQASPILQIDNITSTDAGNYQVYTQMGSCTSSLSNIIMVSVISPPLPASFVINNIDICDSEDNLEVCINDYPNDYDLIRIVDSNSGTILVEGQELCNDLSFLLNSNQSIIILNVIIVTGNCSSQSEESIEISISRQPEENVSISMDSIILCDQEFFNITPDNIPDNVEYTWTSPDPEINIFLNQNDNTSFSNLRQGDNTLVINSMIDNCGIYATDTLIATVLTDINAIDDDVQGAFDNDIIISALLNDEYSNPISFEIVRDVDRGTIVNESLTVRYIPESGYVGEVTFEYEICYTDCPDICDIGVVTITIGDNIECFAGNILTPNNDGYNDTFTIPCLTSGNFDRNKLTIFNQWGDEIYSAAPYGNDWAGTYNGKTLPVGTYFYVIDLGDGSQPLQGFLIIEL